MVGYDQDCKLDPEYVERLEFGYGRGHDDFIPGTFKLKASLENDYFIDRAKQKTESFTGIRGVNTQDVALQEGMGPLTDRTLENVGSSDRAILAMRNLLLAATRAVENGQAPRGIDPTNYRTARPHDGLVPKGADWRDAFKNDMVAKW